ncbi:protein kinase domain-containing protein [Spirillospora sp. CA-255316]
MEWTDEQDLPEGVQPLGEDDPRRIGRYEVLGFLGEGGMGRVFYGRAPDGRPVAIKVVRAELAEDQPFRARFRREAASAMRVPRYCTAEVLAADPDAAEPYLVTEYIDGPTLERTVRAGGPLRGADLEQLAVSMAAALAGIHSAGIVHRDLKPANVLLSRVGPRVIDFGIAGAAGATRVTEDGKILGTPAYMAPEQLRADPGPASDVFAWGGVMVFAATGRRPFGGSTLPATAAAIMGAEPDLTGLPDSLRPVVAAALRKSPGARPTPSRLLELLGVTPGDPARPSWTRTDGSAPARPPEGGGPAPAGRVSEVGGTPERLPDGWSSSRWTPPPLPSRKRSRGRAASRALSFLTFLLSVVAIAAVVGWALQQDRDRTAEFMVTDVNARTDGRKAGCGATVDVIGTITTNGTRGQIFYQWKRSDRKNPDPPLQHDMENGRERATVHLRWEIGGTGKRTFTATLTVLNSPTIQDSVTFEYACRE